MIFAKPFMLILLMLIPLIILLHILLRPLITKEISSLMIWEKVKKKVYFKFPKYLLLLLQILTVLFFIFTLSDVSIPFTWKFRRENSIIIIDNSASMKIKENSQSRLHIAKEMAIDLIEKSSGEIMVISGSINPKIINSYSKDKKELYKSIKNIRESDLPNGIEQAMKIASSSIKPDGTIVLISDGAFDYIPSETDNFRFLRAGSKEDYNIGITQFFLRKTPIKGYYQLFIAMNNYSKESASSKLEIYKDEVLLEEQNIEFEGDGQQKLIVNIECEPQHQISARLLIDDLLESDNQALAYISTNENKKILLKGPGNFFLERALNVIPGLIVEKDIKNLLDENDVSALNDFQMISNNQSLLGDENLYDLIIYDRIPPDETKLKGRFLYIDVVPRGIKQSTEKIIPQSVSINMDHPILNSVNFNNVNVLKAWPKLIGPQVRELVSGGNTGLLYTFENKSMRFVYIPFDLTDSDLPLQSAFPILLQNSINWLCNDQFSEEINQFKTGDIFYFNFGIKNNANWIIVDPLGIEVESENNFYDNTIHSGLYEFSKMETKKLIPFNLVNGDESNIRSRFPAIERELEIKKEGDYNYSIYSLLLLATFLTMLVTWFVQEEKW